MKKLCSNTTIESFDRKVKAYKSLFRGARNIEFFLFRLEIFNPQEKQIGFRDFKTQIRTSRLFLYHIAILHSRNHKTDSSFQ